MPASPKSNAFPVAMLATVGIFLAPAAFCAEVPDSPDAAGEQVLTRGPVHEAFAGVISYHPEAGIPVAKEPPEAVEEVPPGEKPEGENVTWIPGYWAWDDERNDFLWVSGIWRALPPGRQWVPGYWGKSGDDYRWTSGYWADTAATTTTYLPVAPPATLEAGPNIAAPSQDMVWIPGCWVWARRHYAWSPGYWTAAQADWEWSPDYYVWTPRGWVFVDGYWDYSVERRGVLFAPVYFEPRWREHRDYRYSPRIVIDLAVLPNHLFLRTRDQHYYFGDYYAASYSSRGFYASFAYQSHGYGYDPIYAHQRWEHREDKDWEKHFESRYQNRRDHENVRPVRTWAAQKSAPKIAAHDENKPVAMPYEQLSRRPDPQRRFQPVAADEEKRLGQRGQEVKKSREGRRNLEANPRNHVGQKAQSDGEPATLELPRSPIVSKPVVPENGRDRAPPRPGKGSRGDQKEKRNERDKQGD